jgi:acyl carrier protein
VADRADDAAWERYIGVVSEISGVQDDKIHRNSLMTRDLGLDSLATFELAVALVDKFEAEGMENELDSVDLRGLTAGAIFDRYLAAEPGNK